MVTRRTTLTLSQACTGFIYYKTAVGMSPHTIADYRKREGPVRTNPAISATACSEKRGQ